MRHRRERMNKSRVGTKKQLLSVTHWVARSFEVSNEFNDPMSPIVVEMSFDNLAQKLYYVHAMTSDRGRRQQDHSGIDYELCPCRV
jgi:hypothetical protein